MTLNERGDRSAYIPNGMMRSVRVLVGESVFETAVISMNDGWLTIEFEAKDDLDSIAVPLRDDGGSA